MDGKSTQLCPQPALSFRGCPKGPPYLLPSMEATPTPRPPIEEVLG